MDTSVDVLVIGAGIQGAGMAQAAAAAGQRVLVVEKSEPASGTSRRSSKLIHGGLRYLESGQFRLVAESLHERTVLLRIAPHLVRLTRFFIPIYPETTRRPWQLSAGLWLYRLLARMGPGSGFGRVDRSEWKTLDGLDLDRLQHVFRYYDGQTDDVALCRAVLRSSQSLGAEVRVRTRVIAARRDASGWRVRLEDGSREEWVGARAVVNAAGPWVNQVLDAIEDPLPRRAIDWVGGTHLEIDGALEQGSYYVESPADRRAVFVMPWKGHTLVGTTETPFHGDPDQVPPTSAEVDYLVAAYARYFPRRPVRVLDSWAGLRVLPRAAGDTYHRSREVMLCADRSRAATFVTVYGGKLTGYRATAQRVLRLIDGALTEAERKADTATLTLPVEPPDVPVNMRPLSTCNG